MMSTTAIADPTSTIAALIGAAADRLSLASTLRRELSVRFCADGMELRSLACTGAVGAIVLDLETARRASVWQAVQTLTDQCPTIPVLIWLSLTGEDIRDLVALATAIKPDAVIIREIDDASAIIIDAIRSARDGSATQRIMRTVERIAPASVRAMLVFAARDAERPLTIHGMAANVGMTRRALFDRLRAAGLPSARDLIHWLRLLHVAARLDAPRTTVDQVADTLRFASGAALRQLLGRMTGLTPEQLREAGGFQYLVGVLEPMLRGARSASAGQDSPIGDLGGVSLPSQRASHGAKRSP